MTDAASAAEDNGRETWTPLVHLRKYGMFLWRDPGIGALDPMVMHLHGRCFWTPEERVQKGWPAFRAGGREEFVRQINEGTCGKATEQSVVSV